MNIKDFMESAAFHRESIDLAERELSGSVDLSRTAEIKIDHNTYQEAENRSMTLSELLETSEYDPTPNGSPLDAFERQLALAGIRLEIPPLYMQTSLITTG